jgi:hypothetical protein
MPANCPAATPAHGNSNKNGSSKKIVNIRRKDTPRTAPVMVSGWMWNALKMPPPTRFNSRQCRSRKKAPEIRGPEDPKK